MADIIYFWAWMVQKNLPQIQIIPFCPTWLFAMEPIIVKGGERVCCFGFSSLIRVLIMCRFARADLYECKRTSLADTSHPLKCQRRPKIARRHCKNNMNSSCEIYISSTILKPNVESVIILKSPCQNSIDLKWLLMQKKSRVYPFPL